MKDFLNSTEWRELEEIMVSTKPTQQITELLVQYHAGLIGQRELVAGLRRCLEPHSSAVSTAEKPAALT